MSRAGLKKMLVAGVAIFGLALCAAQANAGWWWGAAGLLRWLLRWLGLRRCQRLCCGCYSGWYGCGCHHRACRGCGYGAAVAVAAGLAAATLAGLSFLLWHVASGELRSSAPAVAARWSLQWQRPLKVPTRRPRPTPPRRPSGQRPTTPRCRATPASPPRSRSADGPRFRRRNLRYPRPVPRRWRHRAAR